MKQQWTATLLAALIVTPVFAYEAPVVSGQAIGPSPSSEAQPLIPADNSAAPPQQQMSSDVTPAPNSNLSNQVQQLQQQLQSMQGQLEVQSHQLTEMKATQMSLYQDLDRRINLLAQGKHNEATQSMVTGTVAAGAAASANSDANSAPAAIDANPEAPPPRAPAATTSQTQAPATTTDTRVTNTVVTSSAAPSNVDPETQSYQRAYNLLGKQQFTPAKAGFQSYLQQYPQGKYAADSHYWLGELALVDGDESGAIREFTTVTQQYPKSTRVPASLLRLGGIYATDGKTTQAKASYNAIVRNYPNSNESADAEQQLKQLAQTA